jgi:polysaccharide biosynthesis/export protein
MYTKKSIKSLFILLIVVGLFSCSTRPRYNTKFNYFQTGMDSNFTIPPYKDYVLKANDLIAIQVVAGSVDQKDAIPFNTPVSEIGIKGGMQQQQAATGGASFVVDSLGFINYPKLGKIKAAGLTKNQLAEYIKSKIGEEIFNPYVIVKLNQFKINVLGEVKNPGIITFKTEKANIIDALTEAGDLSDFGKREDVLLLRENNGKYESHKIDLTNASFIKSDIFQLQNNDVIYVGANLVKLKTINVNPNFQRDLNTTLLVLNTVVIMVTTLGILRR